MEPPQKRIKTDNVSAANETAPKDAGNTQLSREIEVGISEFVTPENTGFSGILKKRYTDFLVNEILPSGEVLHLRSVATPSAENKPASDSAQEPTESKQTETKAEETKKDEPKEPEFQISDEDNALLESYFGAEKTGKILNLHRRALGNPRARPAELGRVPTSVFSDRELRIQIHQAIRRIFNSQMESSTDNDGVMVISAAVNRNKRGGEQERGRRGDRMNWDELGGSHLHFTIYKENRDTMETVSLIARQLKMNSKSFQFAGTKDRRGATVQRASALRVQTDRLAKLNRTLRNASLGDFEYRPNGLDLGDLSGNEFVITLRECEVPGVDLNDPENAIKRTTEIVGSALRNLRERGYFNYYGLQRFGTFATRTDAIGIKMLHGDFQGACDAILHFNPHVLAAAQAGEESTALISSDDRARAEAIHIFQTTGRVNDAVAKMPHKFAAEGRLIKHLARAKNDHYGALQTIPRNLRLMYVHAYQSFVWNYAVGERWRLYGDKVVEGDLVIVHEHRDKEAPEANQTEAAVSENVDADGEVIILPKAEDSAYASEDMFTRARALTAEEAASGKYSIFDIVLPLPGFDIIYPANEMTEFYKRFMGSEQGGRLDPFDMRRKWRDYSLSGSYRKVLSRMGPDYSFDVKLYSDPDQQFVQTDLDAISGNTPDIPETGDKLAIILKFQLGASQYATMALRELMKGNAKSYVPDFSGGR